MNNENQQTSSKQGGANEQQDQLGGTTNISLDQLKKEGGIANSSEDNPDRIESPDDLHEIQAGDDLNEPNTNELQPENNGEENEVPVDRNDEDSPAK